METVDWEERGVEVLDGNVVRVVRSVVGVCSTFGPSSECVTLAIGGIFVVCSL